MPRALPLLLVLGCTGPAESPVETVTVTTGGEAEREPRLSSADDGPRVSFNLEHASLPEVARMLGNLTGLRVVLDAEVDRSAECLTISVYEPNLITADDAVAVTRRAYAAVGVQLERSQSQLVFSRLEDAELPACLRAARPSQPSTSTPQAQPPSTPTPTLADVTRNIGAGIRSVSADEVLLTRAAADEMLLHQALLFRTARLIPHEANGRVIAVKMYGIRRNSVLGRLGFRNGDGLQRINGYDLTSPDSALEAYARVRGATELRVELLRRGRALTQTIRIVESLP